MNLVLVCLFSAFAIANSAMAGDPFVAWLVGEKGFVHNVFLMLDLANQNAIRDQYSHEVAMNTQRQLDAVDGFRGGGYGGAGYGGGGGMGGFAGGYGGAGYGGGGGMGGFAGGYGGAGYGGGGGMGGMGGGVMGGGADTGGGDDCDSGEFPDYGDIGDLEPMAYCKLSQEQKDAYKEELAALRSLEASMKPSEGTGAEAADEANIDRIVEASDKKKINVIDDMGQLMINPERWPGNELCLDRSSWQKLENHPVTREPLSGKIFEKCAEEVVTAIEKAVEDLELTDWFEGYKSRQTGETPSESDPEEKRKLKQQMEEIVGRYQTMLMAREFNDAAPAQPAAHAHAAAADQADQRFYQDQLRQVLSIQRQQKAQEELEVALALSASAAPAQALRP